MKNHLKISPHQHSLKYRPHEHTSYAALFILLVIVGVALTMFSLSPAYGSPGPEAGSIGLTGAMPGKAPTTAATITSPANNQRFSISPVKVAGTCPKDTLVEVYKNDIFAGSAACSDTGSFAFDIDLLIGQNILVARVYDALNQPGPDSNQVTVLYDALPPQASSLSFFNFTGAQLILNTDAIFRGSFPNKTMTVPVTVIGGTPPYAINFQWGDATNTVVPRSNNDTFNAEHIYKKAGIYQLSLQGTDSQGRSAFLTVAVIINGQPDPVAATAAAKKTNKLLLLWPLFVALVAIVTSFWLGEKREKKILLKQMPQPSFLGR